MSLTVRFVLPDESYVEYDLDEGRRAPAVGEAVIADGSDPRFPAGIYKATSIAHHVQPRGPWLAVVELRWVYENPRNDSGPQT